MIKGKNLPNGFWVEDISTIVYPKNRSLAKFLERKNPYESLYGYTLVVNHLRIFSSKASSHIPNEDRRKLESIKCIFIDYSSDYKAYKMYDPITHTFFCK